jgi:RNA polymerase sigma-70 factor (ECF subfamily)
MDDVRAAHSDDAASTTEAPDGALALAARQSPAAFAELYRRHLPRVYRYLLARTGDIHQAQDLAAQTFLAALEHIAAYRGQGEFAAWLLTIARNKAHDHFRRGRRPTLPLDAAAEMAAPGPAPEQLVAGRLEVEQVAHALRTLAPDRSEALALRLFSGLSIAEVGRVMGKSEAAAKMLVHRAMRDLRERLAFEGEAE